ncbi:MBL fold metallo-hydrolase [Zoogloea sp.]|uniref:MBL fold metallo-hydrolase n=1 Tax=Zoogloea sp. TaxID=49181 RepID=UPI0032208011
MARSRLSLPPWLRAIVAFALVAAGSLMLTEPAVAQTLKPVRVSEHAWYVLGDPGMASAANQGFNSNAGFVVTRDSVIVIDALGTPPLGDALLAAIRGVSNKPVKRVILTHYHADHFYGLAAFKALGAEVWAHEAGQEYFGSGEAAARLEQRRKDLFPWVDENTRLIQADRWLKGDTRFEEGGLHFRINILGPAHAPEDLVLTVEEDGVVFCGDILFAGRIPFVGNADSKRWLAAIDTLVALKPKVLVTGHGSHSTNAAADLRLTRDYLLYLREQMGKAVEEMVPFEEAYARTDWSRYSKVPAFEAANRINAYGSYLTLERESLAR